MRALIVNLVKWQLSKDRILLTYFLHFFPRDCCLIGKGDAISYVLLTLKVLFVYWACK